MEAKLVLASNLLRDHHKLYELMPKRIEKCFRKQASKQNIDIMVVFVFSVRFIAH